MLNYEMSEELFLDVWRKYGCKRGISDIDEIISFLNDLIDASKGKFILDHFSGESFDCVTRVEKVGDYVKFVWRDFDFYRQKYLSKTITETELLIWETWGYATYIYAVIDIERLEIQRQHNHLLIFVRANYIEFKQAKKRINSANNELIFTDRQPLRMYTEFEFYEGSKDDMVKHDCLVYTMPFYVFLLQPKQNAPSAYYSRYLLAFMTINEIRTRFDKTVRSLLRCNEKDVDDIFSKGNSIRRLLEYAIKYYRIYMGIETNEIDQKYGHWDLGDLRKGLDMSIEMSVILQANELSHDSGKRYRKEDVLQFAKKVDELLKDMEIRIKSKMNSDDSVGNEDSNLADENQDVPLFADQVDMLWESLEEEFRKNGMSEGVTSNDSDISQ